MVSHGLVPQDNSYHELAETTQEDKHECLEKGVKGRTTTLEGEGMKDDQMDPGPR